MNCINSKCMLFASCTAFGFGLTFVDCCCFFTVHLNISRTVRFILRYIFVGFRTQQQSLGLSLPPFCRSQSRQTSAQCYDSDDALTADHWMLSLLSLLICSWFRVYINGAVKIGNLPDMVKWPLWSAASRQQFLEHSGSFSVDQERDSGVI